MGGGGGGNDCHCESGKVNINPFGCECVGPGNLGGSVGSAAQDFKNSFDPKNPIGSLGAGTGAVVGTAVLGPAGGVLGANAGKNLYNGTSNQVLGAPPKAPTAPGQDPALAAIKGQQVDAANSFRAGLPNTQRDLYEGAYKSERQNLGKNIQGVRNNANQRGLLYSGIEQGSELGQRNNSDANLSQAKTEINNSTNDTANQLDANAVQSGIMQQQSIASIQDQTMSQALTNMAARRATYSGIGQGVGAAAGTYAANQNAPRYNQNATSYGVGQPTLYGT